MATIKRHKSVPKIIHQEPFKKFTDKEKCKQLSPPILRNRKKKPQENDKTDEEKAWLNNITTEIIDGPLQQAKGGTLVLCTSYTQVMGLTENFSERGVDPSRIIPQEHQKKFVLSKNEFIEAYRAGKRPVLIALGLAWTGLDLLDKEVDSAEPHKDELLTDLVIIRCPLGLNKSTSMLSRIDRTGIDPIIKEALLMLKQGLGRLIRRDKVRDRHIWIMDGRLWREWDKMERFTSAARSLLGKYKKQKRF